MATKPTAKNSITQEGKVYYLNNRDLLPEVKKSKEAGKMTDTLARMLMLLCANYARKGNFVNYSYNEDMQAYAMMMLVRTWHSFDPEKGSNPFAFFTQCIKNSFIQFLKHEQKQRDVKNVLMIDQGLNPSYGYEDNDRGSRIEDEQDFDTMRYTFEAQTRTKYVDGPIERDDQGEEVIIIPDDVDDTDYVTDPDTPTEPQQ